MPQVGDTRQCLGALVDDPTLWEPLLQHRFTEGILEGVSVGNVVLAALSATHGSLATAVEVGTPCGTVAASRVAGLGRRYADRRRAE